MKNKKSYSPTAKERKEVRAKTLQNNNLSEAEVAELTAIKKKKTNLFFLIGAIILGLVLILFAVLLPLVFFPAYFQSKNPVAKFELSNGMILEIEIWEEACPIAATNFIFLAKNKFFDNTIIHDTQHSYTRFGGLYDYKNFKFSDKTFTDTLTGFEESKKDYKLGYSLYADKNDNAKRVQEEGVISFLYNKGATYFQICGLQGAQLDIGNTGFETLSASAFGKALNEETVQNLKKIAALEVDANNGTQLWIGPREKLSIKKVTMYNLNKKYNKEKWKNFHFQNYMSKAYDGQTAISGWNDRP